MSLDEALALMRSALRGDGSVWDEKEAADAIGVIERAANADTDWRIAVRRAFDAAAGGLSPDRLLGLVRRRLEVDALRRAAKRRRASDPDHVPYQAQADWLEEEAERLEREKIA